MIPVVLSIPLSLGLAAALGLNVPTPRSPDSLANRIQHRISEVPGAVVAVAFSDLRTSDTLYLRADESFHAASTMKVPVMIELFRRADARALRLDQGILLINRFGSIVDGSPYSLDAGADSDSGMYRRIGQRVAVRSLIDHMITRSSNLATNALIELVGARNADSTAHLLGARNIRVLRGVEDGKAFAAGLNNTTTARDLAVLLEAIESGRAATPASCTAMRDILVRQEFSDEIPAGLPKGTRVAHKTGWITGVLHDAAVVYPEGRAPYVLVVLTRGIPQRETAQRLIADISRLVYRHAAPGELAVIVAVGTDHAGFSLKASVVEAIRRAGHEVLDVGAYSVDQNDDYPDFAAAVARAVIDRRAERGVILCGSGVGASVAANKFNGIRSALCHDTFSARQGVEDDAMNVLTLGARVIGPSLAAELVRVFLAATFSDAERHRRRLEKVKAFERHS